MAKHKMFMRSPYKISFCTVCMNRLHHLKETLPANLKGNASYPNAEFILLDYNSSDGLEQWVKTDLKEYIDSGRLVYYRTTEPKYFQRSHSRNMAFKLATGDIVCNVDADNFTGKGFAHYINRQFMANRNIFIIPDIRSRFYYIRDVFGRICCLKQDFEAAGGFDEQLEGYGHEDVDFIYRLIKLNREEVVILDHEYLKAISHTDVERVQYEFLLANLTSLYILHLTPHSSRLLFLFSDGTCSVGTLIDTILQNSFKLPTLIDTSEASKSLNGRYALTEGNWQYGSWHQHENTVRLSLENFEETYRKEGERLVSFTKESNNSFVKITRQKVIIKSINIYTLIKNSKKVHENKAVDFPTTDTVALGKGSVIKNFMHEVAVSV